MSSANIRQREPRLPTLFSWGWGCCACPDSPPLPAATQNRMQARYMWTQHVATINAHFLVECSKAAAAFPGSSTGGALQALRSEHVALPALS